MLWAEAIGYCWIHQVSRDFMVSGQTRWQEVGRASPVWIGPNEVAWTAWQLSRKHLKNELTCHFLLIWIKSQHYIWLTIYVSSHQKENNQQIGCSGLCVSCFIINSCNLGTCGDRVHARLCVLNLKCFFSKYSKLLTLGANQWLGVTARNSRWWTKVLKWTKDWSDHHPNNRKPFLPHELCAVPARAECFRPWAIEAPAGRRWWSRPQP